MTTIRAAASLAAATLVSVALAARAAGPAKSGSATYAQNCAYCHGGTGHGDGASAAKMNPRPPDLTKSRLGTDGIEGIVRNGKNACPSWKSSLSSDEIHAVAEFAKSLQK